MVGTPIEKLYAEKLFESFQSLLEELVPEDDEEFYIPGKYMFGHFQQMCDKYLYFTFYKYLLLFIADNVSFCDDEDEASEDEETQPQKATLSKYDDVYQPPSPEKKRHRGKEISYQRKKAIVDLWDKHPKWNWLTLKKNGCPEIPSERTLYNWRKQIKNGSSKLVKYRQISQFAYEEMMHARVTYKIIRASHIRNFAIQKFLELKDEGFHTFKASESWLSRFKSRHNISSRKITRLVSKREVKSEQEIIDSALKFQNEIKSLAKYFDDDHIFNTDQCGFQYELTSQRTYTKKGEKSVWGFAQSPKNLATHSYTVQYIISMAGDIVGKVFICLQESSGKLGPRVSAKVDNYLPSNVTLTCSSSGKMSTSLNEYFIQQQIVPNVSKIFLHIVDSWSGHTNVDSYSKFFGEANNKPDITLKVIPEKCTPISQPLDTTFHRQLKYLAREILAGLEVFVNTHGINSEDNWNTRRGIIKLQSFLHFQLTAPIFKPLIQYSWYSSGLTDYKPEFRNVKEVCFTYDDSDPLHCEMQNCRDQRFLKCSNCRKCICLHHLWIESHFEFCESSPFSYT